MDAKGFISVLLGTTAAIVAPTQASAAYMFHTDHVLGTSLDVTIVSVTEPLASIAVQAVHSEIARLDAILSGWRGDSELASLNMSRVSEVSPDLFNVIAAGESWREKTGGAFSLRLGRLASANSRDAARLAASIERADVILTADTHEIARPEAVQFSVDAIAKGYIVDKAMAAARNVPGIQGVMIDIGGDLRCWGQSPTGKCWNVGVVDAHNQADNAPPSAILVLCNGAVATSGKGARAQTIFDPASGRAREGILMATAFAPTATDADALASAFYVLPPEQSLVLANSLPGVAAHIVDTYGNTHVSDAWNGMLLAQNVPAKPKAVGSISSPWPEGFSVEIGYEIPVISGGRRARPPYVTIWVSKEGGEAVRTLAFYADKGRYMPENYIYWDGVRGNNTVLSSVTRPTRPPGAYTVEWDGRDDAGRPVPQGRYTISIEAAREHGGHSIQRIDIDLGSSPASAAAPGQQEIGPVKVTYGK